MKADLISFPIIKGKIMLSLSLYIYDHGTVETKKNNQMHCYWFQEKTQGIMLSKIDVSNESHRPSNSCLIVSV